MCKSVGMHSQAQLPHSIPSPPTAAGRQTPSYASCSECCSAGTLTLSRVPRYNVHKLSKAFLVINNSILFPVSRPCTHQDPRNLQLSSFYSPPGPQGHVRRKRKKECRKEHCKVLVDLPRASSQRPARETTSHNNQLKRLTSLLYAVKPPLRLPCRSTVEVSHQCSPW